MNAAPNPHSAFAAEEFLHRRKALQAALDARRHSRAALENTLNAWAAIACAAGADLPDLRLKCIWPAGATSRPLPDDFAPRDQWRAELERARDRAISKSLEGPFSIEATNRAVRLNMLANHLGCTPITGRAPTPAATQRKAA